MDDLFFLLFGGEGGRGYGQKLLKIFDVCRNKLGLSCLHLIRL